MTWLYRVIRPGLFALPPETAHRVTHGVGERLQETPALPLLRRTFGRTDDRLAIEALGYHHPTPLGVAAGFDKDGRMPALLGALGFGHVEIGGVTARPQEGNRRPRLFRLPADRALINRMGFNNDGADRIADRLEAGVDPVVPLGINIGKTKEVPAEAAPADYVYTYERLASHGDFFVINVSSPNTPGLRELQHRDHLEGIVTGLRDAGADPLLVKVSPDLSLEAIRDVARLVEERDLAGVVATNTTRAREGVRSPEAAQPGGLSGAPLAERATEVIATVAAETDATIVGVGGILTADDAYEKLRAGASLLQLYTALIYRGPGVARAINRGIVRRLERDGFASIADVVGVDRP